MSSIGFTSLPTDVICGSILPLLRINDLLCFDTSFTSHILRPFLRNMWTSYVYDDFDEVLNYEEFQWLHSVGIRIRSTNLYHCDLTVVTIMYSIPTLKKLCVENISDDVLVQVAENCPQLEVLHLNFGDYSQFGLITVAQRCHQLHTILFKNKQGYIFHAAIQALCDNCPHLRHIHCSNLSDACLISIASSYPHLEIIEIIGSGVTDAGLFAIADKCHELTSISIIYCHDITSSGLAALWAANPSLTELDISENESDVLSDGDIKILLQCCPQLRKLNVGWSDSITDAAVIAVAEQCPQLTSLMMRRCYFISDAALIAIGRHCHRLKSIDISYIRNVSSVGISALAAGCPLLQDFVAYVSSVTDVGMISLARGCRDLRKIDLSWCKCIGFDAISAIAEYCPLLSDLNLRNAKSVDDTCIYVLAKYCHNLTTLDVRNTDVSGADIVLSTKSPMLKILS